MNIGEKFNSPLRPVMAPPEGAAPDCREHAARPHRRDHAREARSVQFEVAPAAWEKNTHCWGQAIPMPPNASDDLADPFTVPAASGDAPSPAGPMTDGEFVTDLYKQLLGRAPDLEGYHNHRNGLEQGMTRDQIRQVFLNSSEYKGLQAAKAALPVPPSPVAPGASPVAPKVAPPPITIDTVKDAAREYLAKHPEIANEPSYENVAAVAQLREGVIAILQSKGYKAGRILGPDGKPYDQMIAFGNAGDADAQAYRVTAGGARISEAINVGYCNDNVPWADVH